MGLRQTRGLFGFGAPSVMSAVKDGDVAKLTQLIQDGVDPAELNKTDMLGFTPLDHAVAFGEVELLEALLTADGIEVEGTPGKDAPLHAATAQMETGDRIAAALLAKGATVDHPGKKGITPLHRGLSTGNIPAVKVLLDAGADIDKPTQHGMDAVDWAEAVGQRHDDLLLHELLTETRKQRWAADPAMNDRLEELEQAKKNIGGYTAIDPRVKTPKY